mmetsp:Transcript_108350/g.314994  ORF Transcript_108350/g.314994 Transcript_108350/m.314994 type:complete len:456 (+) Transcript_108350:575-1942(+)
MCKADAKLPASVSSPNFLDSKKETAKPQLEAASNPNMRSLLSLTWQNDAAACLDSLLGDTRSSSSCAKMFVDTGALSHATGDESTKVPGEQLSVRKFVQSDQMLRAAAGGASERASSSAIDYSSCQNVESKSMDSSGHDVGMLNDIIFQKLQEHSAQQQHSEDVERPPATRHRSDSITSRKRSSSEIEVGESAFDCLEKIDDAKVDDRVFLPNGKAFRTGPARTRSPSPRTSTETTPTGSPLHSPQESPAAPSSGSVDMEMLARNLMMPSTKDDLDEGFDDQKPSKIDEFVARLQATGAAAQTKIFLRGSGQEYVTSDAAQAIAAALAANTTVRHLGIVGCGLTVPGAKVLADGLRANKSVVTLDFSRCGLTFPATIALIEALNDRTSSVHNLYMKGCGICDASAYVIAQRLSLLPRVKYINLSQNRISKVGIVKLGCGIKANIQNGGYLRRVDH